MRTVRGQEEKRAPARTHMAGTPACRLMLLLVFKSKFYSKHKLFFSQIHNLKTLLKIILFL